MCTFPLTDMHDMRECMSAYRRFRWLSLGIQFWDTALDPASLLVLIKLLYTLQRDYISMPDKCILPTAAMYTNALHEKEFEVAGEAIWFNTIRYMVLHHRSYSRAWPSIKRSCYYLTGCTCETPDTTTLSTLYWRYTWFVIICLSKHPHMKQWNSNVKTGTLYLGTCLVLDPTTTHDLHHCTFDTK